MVEPYRQAAFRICLYLFSRVIFSTVSEYLNIINVNLQRTITRINEKSFLTLTENDPCLFRDYIICLLLQFAIFITLRNIPVHILAQ